MVILYEVDTGNERLAIRSIDIFADGRTRNIPVLYDGAIEITPVPTVEELNEMCIRDRVGPFVRRGQGEALFLQTVLKVQIVHLVIEADLPTVTIPFETGTAYQSKTVPVSQSELAKIFQPFRAQSWVLQFDWLPVNFLQLPAHQHGANGHLPDGSHTLSNEFCRVLLLSLIHICSGPKKRRALSSTSAG